MAGKFKEITEGLTELIVIIGVVISLSIIAAILLFIVIKGENNNMYPKGAYNIIERENHFSEFDLEINGGKQHFLLYKYGSTTAITVVGGK